MIATMMINTLIEGLDKQDSLASSQTASRFGALDVQSVRSELMLSVTARAAPASWFLALGAEGSAESDLAAISNLLETMETLLNPPTTCCCISSSCWAPAITKPVSMNS